MEDLRSHFAISSASWGGTRYPPRVFTEHGVVMAGTLLKTPRAIQATRLVVRTFVQMRHQVIAKSQQRTTVKDTDQPAFPLEFRTELMTKIAHAIGGLLEAIASKEEVEKAQTEAQGVLSERINSLKALLKKPNMANEKTAADIRKLMAEADNIEADTQGKKIKNEERRMALLASKLNLMLQAQHFAQTGQTEGFLSLLSEFDQAKLIEHDKPTTT